MLLGVNIDHVATLRQVRGTSYPSIVDAVHSVEQGGADFITAHLREDRRHIQDQDVVAILQASKTWLNLEIAATDAMVQIACSNQPRSICLVPERREELTTEGGLNVIANQQAVASAIARLTSKQIEVSLFIEADPPQIELAAKLGADAVEFHTGSYANLEQLDPDSESVVAELVRLASGIKQAVMLGLKANAGHGLTCKNVGPIVALGDLVELNIGHSIVADAITVGLSEAVRKMRQAIGI